MGMGSPPSLASSCELVLADLVGLRSRKLLAPAPGEESGLIPSPPPSLERVSTPDRETCVSKGHDLPCPCQEERTFLLSLVSIRRGSSTPLNNFEGYSHQPCDGCAGTVPLPEPDVVPGCHAGCHGSGT